MDEKLNNNKKEKTFVCDICEKKVDYKDRINHLKMHELNDKNNHNDIHKHHLEDDFDTYTWKLILAIILLIPVILDLFSFVSDASFFNFISNEWFLFADATIAFVVFGKDYFTSSFGLLKNKKISVNLLVSISIISSYLFSIIVLFFSLDLVLLFSATVEVATIIYFGKYLEDNLSNKIVKDLNVALKLYTKKAILLVDDKEKEISPYEIKVNDILVVYPGEKIPTDGVIIKGETEIDESTFTGESFPVHKKISDHVFGGSISNNKIYIKAEKTLEDSLLGKIVNNISESQNSKPETQKIADKIASYLIPTVLVLALLSFFGNLIFVNDLYKSFEVFVTVLVIACPCSFSLITPLSILVANSESVKKHIILNSKDIFENIDKIDTVVFDKTGTLTKGNISVVDYNIEKNYLPILLEAEKNYNHPISKAIVKTFINFSKNINLETEYIIGKGIKIKEKNDTYYVGSFNYLSELTNTKEEEEKFQELRKEGKIVIYFFNKQKILGFIVLADTLKNEAKEVVEELKNNKISVFMITGDNKITSENLAKEIGIGQKNVYSQVLPMDKYKIIKKMKEEGRKVSFVGDGINDSIALKEADLGISMGSANDISIQSSDITIHNNDLTKINLALKIARATVFTIYIGFFVAIFYNIIFIPLAMFGVLSPLIGAISMAINDTVAIFIALTLKRIKFKN